MLFLPPDPHNGGHVKRALEEIITEEGQVLLGWRDVPTDNATLGETAKSTEPCVRQLFIARSADIADDMAFERKLYVIRRLAEKRIRQEGGYARQCVLLLLQPVIAHHRVQRDAHSAASQRLLPGTH